MKFNNTISSTLKKENQSIHEQSECIDCCTQNEIRGTKRIFLKDISKETNLGWPIYFNNDSGEIRFTNRMTHALVIGSTGTGKSEVPIKNIIYIKSQAKEKPSFVITDLKGDISESCSNHLIKEGYIVRTINLKDPYGSIRYNFLSQVFDDYQEAVSISRDIENNNIDLTFGGKSYGDRQQAKRAMSRKRYELLDSVDKAIIELAFIIIPIENSVKEKAWPTGARNMFCAIIWAMLKDSEKPETGMNRDKFTIENVCRIAFSTDDDCEYLKSWLRRSKEILVVKNAITSYYGLLAKQTRDSYVSSLNTPLGSYTTHAICAITATSNDINLREIANGDKPYAIFIITDDRQKAANSICMMFINNLISELITAADNCSNHSLSRDFIFLCDEFCNMPAMPGLAEKITTLRSRRIWLLMAIQSISQLKQVYGAETSDIIQDNTDITYFLGCNNTDTKAAFAASMGKRTGIKTSFSIANDGSVSGSKFTEDIPVIRHSDLEKLELGEFYVRSRLYKNMKSYITPHFMYAPKETMPYRFFVENDYTPGENQYDIIELMNGEDEEDTQGNDSFWNFDLTDNSSKEEPGEKAPKKNFFDDLLKELEEETEPNADCEDSSINETLTDKTDDEKHENDVLNMLSYVVTSDFSMSKSMALEKAQAFLDIVEFTEDQHMIRVWHSVVDELYQCSEEEYDELKKSFDES